MRFGYVDYAVGLGDLLVYSVFFVAAYKAYGARAATIAAGVIVVMGGFATAFIPFLFNFTNANLDELIPAQSLFGPVAFIACLWMRRHYGRERTMAEYLASTGGPAAVPQVEQAPAPEPASS
jgi:nitrate/nitrite transporter NarK